jgi:ribonuclease Z
MERHTLAGIVVEGLSVGGLETCIHLPGMKVAFDVGRCPPEVVARETLLLTHAHMDHMGGVAYHCATRSLRNLAPPTYVVPHTEVEAFERLFAAWRELDRSDMPHRTVALAPGEEFLLPNGLVARAFRSPHTAPCQGYGIWSRRKKLKPEYAGRSPDELRRLRVEQKVEVQEVIETCEVVFPGDTRIEVVERVSEVRAARLLVLETTFVDERVSVEECRAKGHVHLFEVAERAALFENQAILMTHFSSRYRRAEILAALDARLPSELRARVTPLLAEFT